MRLKDAFTTIFLAGWTIIWLVLASNATLLGYYRYNTRFSGGAIYTREEHPVAFYTLLAITGACCLLGVFLTISHIRSALRQARILEEERRDAANRRAERREKRQLAPPMTDEKKTKLLRRARERIRAGHRGRKDPNKDH